MSLSSGFRRGLEFTNVCRWLKNGGLVGSSRSAPWSRYQLLHFSFHCGYRRLCCWDCSALRLSYYSEVIMGAKTSQITSFVIVYSTVSSGADQRKHQSSASLAFVRGIHRWSVNFPHKGPVTRKMFPFDDVFMLHYIGIYINRTLLWDSSGAFIIIMAK